MGKKLIIAEKPSVAADIARALGGFTKHDEYYEGENYVISSAIGHLLELACPDEYEVKRGKWSFAHLPVIPPTFDLKPIAKTETRLKSLARLIKRKDIDGLINACDAGREGELIFNYITQHTRTEKPVSRLWLQSMTQQSIQEGFSRLKTGAEMRGLADAAICRSESDWLVGINGTRAMTAFNSKTGGFHLTTVGRVQTPTLAIVIERETKIRKFTPRPYWEIEARFAIQTGKYTGKWFDEKFKGKQEDEHARADRLWDEAEAAAIVRLCEGKTGTVSEIAKPENRLSPLLFDLTSLQREANTRFGFSAKTTLSVAQSLYEKHKALTYPRTDSRYLPEDYLATVRETLSSISTQQVNFAPFADEILQRGWITPNKRIFNNAKVSDHFAIIPTQQTPKTLSDIERKLYDFIVRRFLSVFFPAAEYLVTTRKTLVENHAFKTEGKVLLKPGWLVIYGQESSDSKNTLPPLSAKEETARAEEITLKASATRPPPRYTEATLLSAMEGAGKMVEDEELKAAMADRGLGTPATRAQIIENLISEQYILREDKELMPTAKAFSLLTLLQGLGVNELTSPELTGNWEWKLARIEKGELSRAEFMREIAAMTRLIVERAKSYDSDSIPGDFGILRTPCPKCGGTVRETYKKYQCAACDFSLWKIIAGRQFEPKEVEELLEKRRLDPLMGFRSKTGRPFTAAVRLNAQFELEFDFGNKEAAETEESALADFSAQESFGHCPKCGAPVYEYGNAYVCEKSVSSTQNPVKTCEFRTGKIILQQPIEAEEIRKLLREGRTNLLKNFISARTRRKFSAFLVVNKDGKVGFEFEKREKTRSAIVRKTSKPNDATAKTARGKNQA
ncbi:MAG: DNA topoisomerase III [Zoogloeaceae bacterium]|jgi:DNA topoisomerase-3|nr:DNA topoisomerase III [Zoogloeaceae bacterium]